jgi:2',3'-cyclic-nucleotide 2'-phosphodiesterase (5'-nucleotidase family)
MSNTKLTPKQEKFCQKYIELGCATKAYYAAYDAKGSKPITANRAGKALLDNPKIAARVRELQQRALKRHDVTVDSITAELDESRKLATADKQHSAAISATMGKAKLHGLITDKAEVTGKDGGPIETKSTVTMTPDEAYLRMLNGKK